MALLYHIMESTVDSYEKSNTMCIYVCMYVYIAYCCLLLLMQEKIFDHTMAKLSGLSLCND